MPKLVITDGDGSREVALAGEVKAGRLSDNQVQLKVPEASRHHCRFFQEKGSWFVEDLGSSNGTLVNGRKVSKFELQDGDVISIGAASMRFMESDAAAAEPSLESWGDDEISLEQHVFLILGCAGRSGEVVKITGDKATVGRRSKHTLSVSEASVSNDHAEIVKKGADWVVRDLGSSNGTFVDGDKVTERVLASGCVITFGAAPVTFGIGDPKDFTAPTPAAEPEAAAATTAVEVGSFAESPAFELHDMPPAKRGGLGGLLVLLVLLGGGTYAAFYYLRKDVAVTEGGGINRVHQSTNLIPQQYWSFETVPAAEAAEHAAGWHNEDALDGGSTSEVGDPVRSGDLAFQISRRDAAAPPTFVTLEGGPDADITVSGGSAFRLSAACQLPADAAAGVIVSWYDKAANDELHLLSRDVVVGSPKSGWTGLDGIVVAPDGVNRARVGLVTSGAGDCTFDDVSLEPAQAPAGRMIEAKGFRAVLRSDASLRLSRFNRVVTDGAGPWSFPEKGRPQQPWENFQPAEGATEVKGALRGGATLSAAMQTTEHGFRATWTFGGNAAKYAIGIPLGTTDIDVTLLDGDRARRMRAAFAATPTSGVIIGGQGDRARVRFVDGGGKPVNLNASIVADGGRNLVRVDRGDQQVITFEVDLSFDAELGQARELMNQAREAERAGKSAEAIHKLEEVLARFPFEETIEREASGSVERIVGEGRKRARDLGVRVDDARFFHTARIDEQLARDLDAEVARFSGTTLEEELKKLSEGFKADRQKSAAEQVDGEAKAAFQRAQDYIADAHGRREVALAFLEMVAKRYPGTEWADQSKLLIEKVKTGAPQNQGDAKDSGGKKP